MRTTIDIPAALRQKLVTEAAARNMKGFSLLIREALEQYFKKSTMNRTTVISNLRGSLPADERDSEIDRIKASRTNWKN